MSLLTCLLSMRDVLGIAEKNCGSAELPSTGPVNEGLLVLLYFDP